ncbi:Uncharacterised protein [Serratia ficaria]|nr:Uncharacterised protein [Serratia ficaria]CAI2535903.1 Uncharacterised protein [Serratia ficaria]
MPVNHYPAVPAPGLSFPVGSLPVAIDYPTALTLRQMALSHDDYRYLADQG